MSFTSASVTDNGTSLTVNAGVAGSTICVSSENNGATFWQREDNVSSFTFNTSIRPLYVTITKHNYIPYSTLIQAGSITVTTDVNHRWNMLSIPLVAWDFSKSAVFPTSVLDSSIYTWRDGVYVPVDILDNRLCRSSIEMSGYNTQ